MATSWRRPSKNGKTPIRVSASIACIRKSPRGLEMLLVQRRNSYAFGDFILCKYDVTDNPRIVQLFNGMTIEEKTVLATMNFDSIWYHLWLGVPPKWANFATCRYRFFMMFRGPQGEKRLATLISTTTNNARVWSTPKGRRECGESSIECAVREFQEETTFEKDKNYQLLPQICHEYSHTSDGVRYTVITYLGVAFPAEEQRNYAFHNPQVDAMNHWQVHEISDIRWMTLQDMRHTAGAERIYPQAKTILKKYKGYRRGFRRGLLRDAGSTSDLALDTPAFAPDQFPDCFPDQHSDPTSEPAYTHSL